MDMKVYSLFRMDRLGNKRQGIASYVKVFMHF